MLRISDILDKINEYYPDADVDIVNQAYVYSAKVHEGQVRLNGEPYLSHPLEVANILADMHLDTTSIACGLLHDVVEDTHTTVEDIQERFGEQAAKIIAGVTKISKLSLNTARDRQAENLRKMILAMADDLRVILIKLADRLHNIRTLHFHPTEAKKKSIAQETLDIYAPIASRLGIYWIKRELEEISFYYTQPEEYERIKNLVAKDQLQREHYVETVKKIIGEKMKEAGLPSRAYGRYKQFYSIYQKMLSQDLSFEEVYDIIAFRLIMDSIPQCYEALGIIHANWRPVPTKFKDYIGFPKPNGYKSLHTTVIGPYGERMELQIRTEEMDRVANSGIAAHWSYKEGRVTDKESISSFEWIQNLVENHRDNYGDPDEFLENVRIDLFPAEVYVFTPQGEVKNLSRGATPIDFAYLIHTEVGHQCTGAKVNGRLVPLQYELKTGDIVEIVTTKGHQPSKDWLNYVKTGKARSRIRQWIKRQEKERSITLGREMCEKAFRKYRLNFHEKLNSPGMQAVANEFNFKTVDDLIANVGYGKITPLQIIRRLTEGDKPKKEETLIDRFISRRRDRKKRDEQGVVVDGMDDILIRFGQCCQPVPGDPIIGYITHGSGVTVHRKGCVNAMKMNPEREIKVEWRKDSEGSFPVKLKCRARDRRGLLAEITSVISQADANIIDVQLESLPDKTVTGYFTITVANTSHLDTVLAKLRKVDKIQEIRRL
ncbi:MAG TPA: bifunctional (p)ppGpp synthetase/guanosine-3',5'-bis(diphosphate) 3'-pyrophosphohydrolase [Desulfosalsimonadaceae bacterium]|nr:bifunctional (p)ppGpp synthetase/guanosine-3',5'-bis(diphosphate) 3'-pyrophosphohydrolase [Desulfosalsimonadaceae bacterium]